MLTVSGAAARVGAAPAADVAAAGVGTALTPANSNQEQEQHTAEHHGHHKRPLCRDTQTNTCLS